MSPLPLLFISILKVVVILIRQEKEVKYVILGKEVQWFFFQCDMAMPMENLRESTEKLFQTMRESEKVALQNQ